MRRFGWCVWWFPLALLACGHPKTSGPGGDGSEDPATKVLEVLPDSPDIRYMGRLNMSDPMAPRMAWPGTEISIRFTGPHLSVRLRSDSAGLDEYGNRKLDAYDVYVDGARTELQVQEGEADYVIADQLGEGEHEARLFKRTEAWFGQGAFLGFRLSVGATVSRPPSSDRRLEFVGDSVVVALGVEGPDETCDFAVQYQDHAESFAALAAHQLNAEFSSVAASGVGVTKNWNDQFTAHLAELYGRTLPLESAPPWSFQDAAPQAVIINAGSTDFMHGDPGQAAFTAGFEALLNAVRAHRPNALVVVTIGPTLQDDWPVGVSSLAMTRTWVGGIVDAHKAKGERIKLLEFSPDDGTRGYGCDYHPSRATHSLMAAQLVALLQQELGW